MGVEPFEMNREQGLWLSGEFDIAAADQLAEALDRMHAEGQGRVVLDLRETVSLDAVSIGVIIQASRQGMVLDLRNAPPPVKAKLHAVGLRAED